MSWGQLGAAVGSSAPPARAGLPGMPTAELQTEVDRLIDRREQGLSLDPLALPPLFSVVRLIASHLTQVPIKVGGGSAPRWLSRPRSRGSALDLENILQWLTVSMALRGAGYLWCRRASQGDGWEIGVLHPSQVMAQPDWTPQGLRLRFQVAGKTLPLVPWRPAPGGEYLLHIPYLTTPDHPEGCSAVTVARESLYGYQRVEGQAADLLDNGTYSGGRLETDQDISPETAIRYQDHWIANRKTGKVPVLGAGLRYVNDLLSPKDAMWLESRAFNAQQVAMMYGVPPDLLGMTMQGGGSSLAYNNAQDNNRRYLRNALDAFTSQLGAALSQLLPNGRNDDEDQAVQFDFEAWLGDEGGTAPDATTDS